LFRDHGLLPEGLAPPPQRLRCYLPGGHVVGQFIGTGIMLSLGVGLGLLFLLTLPAPVNVVSAAGAVVLFGCLVYLVTRRDYAWVELEGDTIRAKHLYSRRVLQRSAAGGGGPLTLVSPTRAPAPPLA